MNHIINEPKKIKIYTSYYAMYKNINPAFQCIAISNTKPSSIFIPKMKELVPHWSLVRDYKQKKITKQLFDDMYMQQLLQTIRPDNLLNNLLDLHNDTIVFLCYEKDLMQCHRLILLKYIYKWLPELDIKGELNLSSYTIPIGDKPWEK